MKVPSPTLLVRFFAEDAKVYFSPGNKPLRQQASDLYALARKYKFIPYHYVKHKLHKVHNAHEDVLDFVPPKSIERIRERYNEKGDLALCIDKVAFFEWCQANAVPTPQIIPFSDIERLVSSEGRGEPNGLGGRPAHYFVKPRKGGAGRGISRLTISDREFYLFKEWHSRSAAKPVLEAISGFEDYIIQQFIVQHESMAAIYPETINTLRIETIDRGDDIVVNSAVLRVGTSKAESDNWATGGLAIKVDVAGGETVGPGREKNKFGGRAYDCHPDSGKALSGVAIPQWDEAVSICRAAAVGLRPFKMLGWDIAITDKGPTVIEVNEDYSIFLNQEACRGLGQTWWKECF